MSIRACFRRSLCRTALYALASSALASSPPASAADWDAVLLSSTAQGGSGGVPLTVNEGAEAVTALRSAVQRLPRQPQGSPVWRFDLVRDGVRIDSVALSQSEASQLGEAAAPLLRAAQAQPAAFLYRAELPTDALEQLDALEPQLKAAGLRVFHPNAAREYWSTHELMLSAYQRDPRTVHVADSSPGDPARVQFEQRLRSLLQPRPLNELEEGLFQRMLPELFAHYRDLTANPAIRELHVEYERQRWQTAADRRNLLIQARYSVRTPRELAVIEGYLAQRGAPQGTSRRPEVVVLQLVAPDADTARVDQQLRTLIPGLRSLRPGN